MTTTPNILDYLAFLYDVVGIPQKSFLTALGSATDGDDVTLIDSNAQWLEGQWVNYVMTDFTTNESTLVVQNDQTSLSFNPALDQPVSAGDAYFIAPQVLGMSFNLANGWVNSTLACVVPDQFTLAVYNLAADRLINYARDIPNQTYWADLRKALRITDSKLGVVSSTNDEGSGMSYLNPEQFKRLTLADLQNMKTPQGREYLAIAQSYGEEIWGIS